MCACSVLLLFLVRHCSGIVDYDGTAGETDSSDLMAWVVKVQRRPSWCAPSSPKPLDCSAKPCNILGGTCDCGRCVCFPGWGGSTCATWFDPCQIKIIHGCQSCVRHSIKTLKCGWCPVEKACRADPSQYLVPPDLKQCRPFVKPFMPTLCPAPDIPYYVANPADKIIVAIIFLLLSILLCITITIACMFDRPRAQYSVEMYAETGTTSLTPYNVVREVVAVVRIPPRSTGTVQGIPLSQVGLVELRRRHIPDEQEANNEDANNEEENDEEEMEMTQDINF